MEKKILKIKSIICLVTIFTASVAIAATEVVNGIEWTYFVTNGKAEIRGRMESYGAYINGHYETTSYYYPAVSPKPTGVMTIPDKLGGYSVASIGKYAFRECSHLTGVRIPTSVKEIGDYAFFGCSSLKNVTIPNCVTSIGSATFKGCSSLASIVLPFVGSRRGNSGTKESVFGYIFGEESYTGGTKVTQCYDGPVNSPSVAYYIPLSLKSVRITDETVLGYGSFYGCSMLTEININSGVSKIGGYSFRNCTGISNLTLPSKIVNIECGTFRGASKLNELSIPSVVTNIDEFALCDCSGLTFVAMPNALCTIKSSALSGCSKLKSVTIPIGTVSIGDSAFYGCNALRDVTFIGDAPIVSSTTFQGVNSECVAYVSSMSTGWGVDIPGRWSGIKIEALDYVEHDGLSFCIKDGVLIRAASNCSGKIVIPNTVSGIGSSAFFGCTGLNEVVIPSSVTTMGSGCFAGCTNLMSMTLPFVGSCRGNSDTEDAVFGYIFGSSAFEGGAKITQHYDGPDNSPSVDYYVPATLKSITVTDEERLGYGAFYGLRGLTNVSINAGVREIGGYAFRDCTGLSEFVLPDGISEIAAGVFRGCLGLSNLIVPNGVTNIASRALCGCSFASIVLPDGVTSIGESAFSGCSNLAELVMPDSVTSIEEGAFYGCGRLASVTIPNRVTSIATSTFWGCSNLLEVSISDSVTSIGKNAFRNCSALTSIVIPKSVTSIGTDAFSGCSGLTSITLPFIGSKRGNAGTAESLFGYVFGTASYAGAVATKQKYSGSGLTTYYIPSSLKSVVITDETKLSYGAFYGCNGLTSVTIPESVTNIEPCAFAGCSGLPSRVDGYKVVGGWIVGYSDDATEVISGVDELRGIAGGALEGCTAVRSLEFSDKAVIGSIGEAALKGCTELQSLVLPPSLKSIGDEAFMGCSYLGNVIVPGSVKSVGARAFKNCTGFTNAQIEYGVESLGEEAFYGNWQISEVDIPSTVTNIGKSAFGGDSSIIRVGLCGDIRTVAEIFSNYKLIREATVKEGTGAIVDGLFTNCTQLADVRFFGNCPALVNDGSNLYQGTKNTLTTYVSQDSTGWDGTAGSHQLPQAWPLTGSYRKSIAYWDVPTYLVEFDSNGGTLGVQSTYQYSERPFTLPPEPVQTGYRFAGWWTKPSGGLQVTTDTVFIEGVYRRLYAHWLKGHWVFLNPDGGTVTNDFVTYIEQTVYGVLPAAVRTGYAFGGWTYNGQTVLPTTPISTAADHTLVAQWEAYKYSVKFNANGGEGEMADEEMTYDVAKPISANAFRRVGYAFAGWSVDAEAGSADFADGESVVSLTAVADGEVVLFAVWKKDGSNVTLETDGDAEWFMDSSVTHDGAVVWRSGAIGDEQRSVLRANVTGPGKISFWWKVDCEWFRTLRLDSLAFSVDGVERQWINGEKDWTSAEFTVEGGGEHVLEWAYIKDESDDEGGYSDCGWVSEVVWEPVLVTLNDYLNCTNIAFSTSGDAVWFGERDVSHDGFGALRSGAVGDNGTTRIDATVGGPGVISFWWKSDCEASFRTYVLDHCAFYVDGVEKYFINDDSGWERKSFVLGEGQHTLAWVYEKDEEGSSGEDCAWLDEVSWSPSVVVDIGGGKNVTIPVGWLSENTERAVTDVAANGRKVWECYVVGLDPEDTTNDFKIVSFQMKADGTPDISAIAFDPPEAKWNVQGATPVLKGKATLEGTGEWQTVTDENKADMRFFKVEVVLP